MSSMPPDVEPESPLETRPPWTRAVVAHATAIALAEAAAAGWTAREAGVTVGALVLTGATILVVGIPLLTVLWFVLTRKRIRLLGGGFAESLGGTPAARKPSALLALAASMGAATVLGATLGTRLIESMSARFAAAAVVLLTVALSGVALIASSYLGTLVHRALAPLAMRFAWLRTFGTALLVMGASAATFLATLPMPLQYRMMPTLAVAAGGALGVVVFASERVAARNVASWVALVAMWLGSLGIMGAADRFSPDAQRVWLEQAPYASLLVGAIRARFDHDKDGHSAILLGGDCDDADARVYPGARDIPGNSVDENCSGADATRYRPASPPRERAVQLSSTRNNIVVILIDALRPDHLGFNGYARKTSPKIDAFASRSIRFDNAYTNAASTRFAMTAMFTGKDARMVPHDDSRANGFTLLPAADTAAERLARAGYDTVGYTISYVLHHNKGLGQGFRIWNTPWETDDWERTYPINAELTTQAGIEYLKTVPTDGSKPYLLYLHYRCTHDPYFAYPKWPFGKTAIDMYDSSLAYCDDEVGKLLAALNGRPDSSKTATVMLSDHGELFGEHGQTNHGNTVSEPDVRILMLLNAPGAAPARIKTPVSIMDVAPTLLELANVGAPAGLDGWSLLIHGPETNAARPLSLFTDLWRGSVHFESDAVLDYPLKLTRDKRSAQVRLFDVSVDPGEDLDLASARPEESGRLTEWLESYLARIR